MATQKQIRDWMPEIWQWANAEIFGGVLPRPDLYYNRKANEGGCMYWVRDARFRDGKRHIIEISTRIVKSKRMLRSVMVHEMIHQLQTLQRSPRTQAEHHGRFFTRWADKIMREHMIPVTIATDDIPATYAKLHAQN